MMKNAWPVMAGSNKLFVISICRYQLYFDRFLSPDLWNLTLTKNFIAMPITSENFDRSQIWAVVGDIQYGAPETPEILRQRADEFKTSSRPMGKRGPNYRIPMHSHDIVFALDLSLRQAQRILQQDRIALQKQKNDYVTVEEFCKLHRLDEKAIRKKLAEKYGGE